jgi:CheY-like chemotaxis protein
VTPPADDFRLLVIDDEEDIADRLQELLQEELADLGTLCFEPEADFDRAEERLKVEYFDMVILDVRESHGPSLSQTVEARGRELFERISAVRWVPVIFYTAVPEQVRGLEQPPLVQIVTKNRLEELLEGVRAGLESGVPTASRRIGELVDEVVRRYLRDHVSPNWAELSDADRAEIVPVALRRASAELAEESVRILDRDLHGSSGNTVDHSSAARVYLRPPVTQHVTAADILLDPEGQRWLVLTPTCDLYEDPVEDGVPTGRTAKADFVRLARATPLMESKLVSEANAGARGKNVLKSVFEEKSNRYRVLPKFLNIPALLVDFEDVTSHPMTEVRGWARVATLDSPFAEALLTTHSRIVGRVGTPEINFERLLNELGLARKKGKGKTNPTPIPQVPGARSGEAKAPLD